jgi:hypothetical protein
MLKRTRRNPSLRANFLAIASVISNLPLTRGSWIFGNCRPGKDWRQKGRSDLISQIVIVS